MVDHELEETPHARRIDDRDRMLHTRLDQMERDYMSLVNKVTALEFGMQSIKSEQGHLKDLMDARLKVIEKSQELQLTKLDQLSANITSMASDVEKTPAGRTLQNMIQTMAMTVDSHGTTLARHADVHNEIILWQKSVDSVISVMKWMGPTGIIALGLTLLRMAKIIP